MVQLEHPPTFADRRSRTFRPARVPAAPCARCVPPRHCTAPPPQCSLLKMVWVRPADAAAAAEDFVCCLELLHMANTYSLVPGGGEEAADAAEAAAAAADGPGWQGADLTCCNQKLLAEGAFYFLVFRSESRSQSHFRKRATRVPELSRVFRSVRAWDSGRLRARSASAQAGGGFDRPPAVAVQTVLDLGVFHRPAAAGAAPPHRAWLLILWPPSSHPTHATHTLLSIYLLSMKYLPPALHSGGGGRPGTGAGIRH